MTGTPEGSILEGRLDDFPLADILQVLQVSGKSGALFLRRGDGQKAVLTFRNGQIVQALSSDSYQTLGDRLVMSGLINRIDLHEALAYIAHFPGMRVGDALVERGIVTRAQVEDVVKDQIAEVIERLMSWSDADFEFRIGLVMLGRGVPDFAVDFVLESGIEPRHVLLEASLIQDKRNREKRLVQKALGEEEIEEAEEAEEVVEEAGAVRPPEAEDEDARRIVRWFDEGANAEPGDLDEPESTRASRSYLSLSEELFFAQGRGEIGLLLLRYASEIYADGGLVMRDKEGFRVLGQFGQAFWWGNNRPAEPKVRFASGESPLFDDIVADRRPYAGLVKTTPTFGLAPAEPRTPNAAPALAIPLIVIGNVSLILFCRSAVAGAPDARALIALARQVSVTLENVTLRELAKRSGLAGR